MSKLCLGTYLKALKLCAVKNGFTQKIVFRDMFASIDCKYDPDEAQIGHMVRGDKNPSEQFRNTINDMNPDKYFELSDCMDVVVDRIDPNKIYLLVKILKKIINEDDSISDETIVDLINGTTKTEFPGKYDSLSSLLAGVFIYIIKNTDNKNQIEYVKEIDNDYIFELQAKHSISNNSLPKNKEVDELSEDDELKARDFLIRYESVKELIPLCQIAYAYNSIHNYERSMYTDYIRFPRRIRRFILERCEVLDMIEIDNLHWDEGLQLLYNDVEKYKLSSVDNSYFLTQYFPRFIYYQSHSIKEYIVCSFKRIPTTEIISVFPGAICCDLDNYIDSYLWTIEHKMDTQFPKPLDYLCVLKDLRESNEEDIVFWMTRFIIDACNNLSTKIVGKPIWADCFDGKAETIEDLALSALFALHKHYQFHNNIYSDYVIREFCTKPNPNGI